METQLSLLKDQIKANANSIELLFTTDLTKSKRMALSATDHISMLFARISKMIANPLMAEFKQFILEETNVPIEVNLRFLRYEQFIKLFEDWCESISPDTKHKQEMIYYVETTYDFRNERLAQILREKKFAIEQFAHSLSASKRFGDFDINQLFREIFSGYYIYEFNSDCENFFDKVNSFSLLLTMIGQYRQTPRKLDLYEDPKFIYTSEVPYLLKFWEFYRPELAVLDEPRKNLTHNQTQTDTAPYMDNVADFLEFVVQRLTNKFKKRTSYEVEMSIESILQTIKKQQGKISHKYSLVKPKVQEIPQPRKPLHKKTEQYVKEIYQYYQDDKNSRYSSEGTFDLKKFTIFLEEIGFIRKYQTQKTIRATDLLRRNATNIQDIQLEQFVNTVMDIIEHEPDFTAQLIDRFVEDRLQERIKVYNLQRNLRNSRSRSKKLSTQPAERSLGKLGISEQLREIINPAKLIAANRKRVPSINFDIGSPVVKKTNLSSIMKASNITQEMERIDTRPIEITPALKYRLKDEQRKLRMRKPQ